QGTSQFDADQIEAGIDTKGGRVEVLLYPVGQFVVPARGNNRSWQAPTHLLRVARSTEHSQVDHVEHLVQNLRRPPKRRVLDSLGQTEHPRGGRDEARESVERAAQISGGDGGDEQGCAGYRR